jgi:hypothetical protein
VFYYSKKDDIYLETLDAAFTAIPGMELQPLKGTYECFCTLNLESDMDSGNVVHIVVEFAIDGVAAGVGFARYVDNDTANEIDIVDQFCVRRVLSFNGNQKLTVVVKMVSGGTYAVVYNADLSARSI